MKNLDDLKTSLQQINELKSLLGLSVSEMPSQHFFQIGKNYLIQTVTHYYLGELKSVGNQELVLGNASWVSDTGRYSDFVKGSISDSNVEIEPILQDTIIGRGALVSAVIWNSSLPKEVK